MLLTFAQINPTIGDIVGNMQKILACTKKSRAMSSDLVIFPELALTGYSPDEYLHNPHFMHQVFKVIHDHLPQLSPCILPVPMVLEDTVKNTALLITHNKIVQTFQKHILPNESVFYEKRYFTSTPLTIQPIFTLKNMRIGVLICEDFWHNLTIQPLINQCIDLLVVVNASPYDTEKHSRRLKRAKQIIQLIHCPVLYVNQSGGHNEYVMDGRSFLMDTQNHCIVQAGFEEELISVEYIEGTFHTAHHAPSVSQWEEIYTVLKISLRDYVHKNKFEKVHLGLSGGIDSALVATLAADALLPKNVTGILLPSAITSETSIQDATQLAKNLGIQTETYPIESIVNSVAKTIGEVPTHTGELVQENIQARARGVLLMAYANAWNSMLLSTGNKSELAMGFTTLYGDMCGAFNPLKDVYKTTVYDLCRWRNTQKNSPIPHNILTKAPSAELTPHKIDQDTLPPYEELDPVLRTFIECNEAPKKYNALFQKFISMEYKRYQSPPGPKITKKAFGRDRLVPISAKITL